MRPMWKFIQFAGVAFLSALSSVSTSAQQAPPAYSVVSGWPKLPPGFALGQVSGVGVDSKNQVFVFNRAENSWPLGGAPLKPISSPTVLVFDGGSGELRSSWGKSLFKMPHGLRVDKHDNIWLTDYALQQVFKFSHDGKLLLKLGTADTVGCDATHFNGPTDVAVARDGSFYVADGYGSSRIVKFSADGRYLFSWGRCSAMPLENIYAFKGAAKIEEIYGIKKTSHPIHPLYDGPTDVDTPHSIDLDPDTGLLYVADRDNARIQVYDEEGKHVKTFKSSDLGRPWALTLGSDHLLYVVDGGDLTDGPADPDRPFREGIVKVDLSGKVLARWSSFGNQDGQILWGHDIAVGGDGAVYVGDVYHGMRVQKFVPAGNSR